MAVDQEGRAVRDRLLWKLLAINLPVIGVVILVVWVAVDFLAADYFTVLMERYKISPADTHQMFVDAVHRYLYYASLIAAVIAVLLSFLLTRTVLRPLSQMTEVTQRIAAGDYTARVDVKSKDELARLGLAFNRMADSLEQVEQLRERTRVGARTSQPRRTERRHPAPGARDGRDRDARGSTRGPRRAAVQSPAPRSGGDGGLRPPPPAGRGAR